MQWSDVQPPDQLPLLHSCAADISRIYALDLFVANDDRHLNNFLFRDQTLAGQRTVIAMDFSRGLLIRGWPSDPVPMPMGSNTMRQIQALKVLGIWDAAAATLTLNSIATVTASEAEHWLKAMPRAWLATSRIDAIVQWWDSPAFGQRLADCGILV